MILQGYYIVSFVLNIKWIFATFFYDCVDHKRNSRQKKQDQYIRHLSRNQGNSVFITAFLFLQQKRLMTIHSLILIFLISIAPVSTLLCYECACNEANIAECNCGATTNEIDDYCIIKEDRNIDGTSIELTRTPRNTTYVYIEDSYYILAIESIRYNLTTKDWYTWPSGIIFGCDWDLCNAPDRIETLPYSFTVSINKTWLDTNIYGNGSVDSCHWCPYGICADSGHPFNISECPFGPCANATSVIWFLTMNIFLKCYFFPSVSSGRLLV